MFFFGKKSILFIADKPDWAYHNIIKCWEEFLRKDFDCYIAFTADFMLKFHDFSAVQKVALNLINPLRGKNYHRIDRSRQFSIPVYGENPVYDIATGTKTNKIHFDAVAEMAFYFQFTSKLPFTANKRFVGIYTDSFPHEGPHKDKLRNVDLHDLSRQVFFENYLAGYDGIIVGNTNLYNDYQNFTDKLVMANGIYRQDNFQENSAVGTQEALTIGWTGNPNRPMKGFKEIIEPAIEKVKQTGRKVTLKTKFSGPYDDLLTFYKDVDLICIASEADTGPSLFAEAALCNVPAVSTEIGFPKMIIKNNENGIFVSRDIDEMAGAIIRLYDDRELLQKFSASIKTDYLRQLNNRISAENLKKFLNNTL